MYLSADNWMERLFPNSEAEMIDLGGKAMDDRSPKEAVLKMKRWSNDSIAAGRRHTVALKSDGTVTAAGDNKIGQCDVSGRSGIQLPGK